MGQNPQFCTKVLAYIQADIFSDIKKIEKKILRLGGSSILGLTLPSKHSQPSEAKETRGNIARVFFYIFAPHYPKCELRPQSGYAKSFENSINSSM